MMLEKLVGSPKKYNCNSGYPGLWCWHKPGHLQLHFFLAWSTLYLDYVLYIYIYYIIVYGNKENHSIFFLTPYHLSSFLTTYTACRKRYWQEKKFKRNRLHTYFRHGVFRASNFVNIFLNTIFYLPFSFYNK